MSTSIASVLVQPGTTLTTISKRPLTITESVPEEVGGQGNVLRAADSDGRPVIVKLSHSQFDTPDNRKRMRWLKDRNVAKLCPAFVAPVDLIELDGVGGTVQPIAAGQSLDSLFAEGTLHQPSHTLSLAAGVCHALHQLDRHGLGHGDLQAQHVFVDMQDTHCELAIIDLDNFHTTDASVPPPGFLGEELHMAPELRPTGSVRQSVPDRYSDRFALAVLLSELVLLRHPTSGFWMAEDDSPKNQSLFHALMSEGTWLHDPTGSRQPSTEAGGHAPEILNPELTALFRRGFSLDRHSRPAPEEWRNALFRSLFQILACPYCGYENISDSSKRSCPDCRRAYPPLVLTGSFGRIVLDRASVILGRDQLQHDTVSQKHVVIRRNGADFEIADHSTNGTFRRGSSGNWHRLPDHRFVRLQPGDHLKLGELPIEVSLAM